MARFDSDTGITSCAGPTVECIRLTSNRHGDLDGKTRKDAICTQQADDLFSPAERHGSQEEPEDAPPSLDARGSKNALTTSMLESQLVQADVDPDVTELEAKLELLELQRAWTQQSCAEYLSELERDLLSRQRSLPVPAATRTSAARDSRRLSSKRLSCVPPASHQSSSPHVAPQVHSGSFSSSPSSHSEANAAWSFPPRGAGALTAAVYHARHCGAGGRGGSSIGVNGGSTNCNTGSHGSHSSSHRCSHSGTGNHGVSHTVMRPRARSYTSASSSASGVPLTFCGPYGVASSRSTGNRSSDALAGDCIIMTTPGGRSYDRRSGYVYVSGSNRGGAHAATSAASAHGTLPVDDDSHSLLGWACSPPLAGSRVPAAAAAAGSMRLSRSSATSSGYHMRLPDRRFVSERAVLTTWSLQLPSVDSLPSISSPLGRSGSNLPECTEDRNRSSSFTITMDAVPASPPFAQTCSPSWMPAVSPCGVTCRNSSHLSSMLRETMTSSTSSTTSSIGNHISSSLHLSEQSRHLRSSSTSLVPSLSSLPPSSSLLPPIRHASMDIRATIKGGRSSTSSSRLSSSPSYPSQPLPHPPPLPLPLHLATSLLGGRDHQHDAPGGIAQQPRLCSTAAASLASSSSAPMALMTTWPSFSCPQKPAWAADLAYYEPARGPLLRSSSDARRQMGGGSGSRAAERLRRRRAAAAAVAVARGGMSASVPDLQLR